MLEREFDEFGRRMGMAGFCLGENNMAALDVDGLGVVFFEYIAAELLVYVARACEPHDSDLARRILARCHYAHGHSMPLQGGMKGDRAFLMLTRIPEQEVSPASIENAILFLSQEMDRVER